MQTYKLFLLTKLSDKGKYVANNQYAWGDRESPIHPQLHPLKCGRIFISMFKKCSMTRDSSPGVNFKGYDGKSHP